MTEILAENTIVLLLAIVLGAIVLYAVREFTPAGHRYKQRQNYRAALDHAARTCPTHGVITANALVRLDDGTLACPHCFPKTLNALDS